MKLREYIKYDYEEYNEIILTEDRIIFINYNFDGTLREDYSDIVFNYYNIEDYEEERNKLIKKIEENENIKEDDCNF